MIFCRDSTLEISRGCLREIECILNIREGFVQNNLEKIDDILVPCMILSLIIAIKKT